MNGIRENQGDEAALRFLRSMAVALGAGLLLGRLGPFNTFRDLPAVERYGYWVGLTLLLWVQIEAVLHILRTVPWLARLHWAARAGAAALLGSVPGAFEVAWAESALRVERDLGLADVGRIYGDVALIALAVTLAIELLNRPQPGPAAPAGLAGPEAAPASPAPGLLSALPPAKRGALIALASEDHYLRVYTEAGDTLIHHRFGDALAGLGGADGLQVHRRWWVARGAVTGAEREGDRLALTLSNGLKVPVSRTYLLAVRQAGLA